LTPSGEPSTFRAVAFLEPGHGPVEVAETGQRSDELEAPSKDGVPENKGLITERNGRPNDFTSIRRYLMDISIKGIHVDVGEALSGHAEANLKDSVKKYFDSALNSTVVFSKKGHGFHADITVHAGRGMVMQGGATADDAYAAFDSALNRISKQLRRYKSRLQDHHKHGPSEEELIRAQYAIMSPEADEDDLPEQGSPAIVAEMPHEIATLTVGEAVMRMDLADAPVVMFRNRAHGGFNVVYRRADGNVGWIDPNNIQ